MNKETIEDFINAISTVFITILVLAISAAIYIGIPVFVIWLGVTLALG